MDGWITIGTKLATDKFDKQIYELENDIKVVEKEMQINLETKTDAEKQLQLLYDDLDRLDAIYASLEKKQEQFNILQKEVFSGRTLTEEGTKKWNELQDAVSNMAKVKAQTSKTINEAIKLEDIVSRTSVAYDKSANKVQKLKNRIESIKLNKQQSQVKDINSNLNGVVRNTGTNLKQIGRLALGVLSVASAYRLLSKASSTLSQYDAQYEADLKYFEFALAQVLAPVLKYIVNLASILLQYVNAIVQAWFGVNLLSGASAKNFEKAQKSTSKIKKDLQTTPFDEMNILQDTSGGDSGIATPSFDLSGMNVEIPPWMQWLIDNKDIILSILGGIASGILAIKIGLGGIKALGFGVLMSGIIYAVQKLIEYLNDPSLVNLGGFIQGIGVALLGLAIIIGSIPVAVISAVVLIWGTIVKYWDQISAFLQSGIDWLTSKSDWIRDMFGDTAYEIYKKFTEALQRTLDFLNKMFSKIKENFDLLINFVQNVFAGNWEQAWENIKQIFLNILEGAWEGVKVFFQNIWSGVEIIVMTIGDIITNMFKYLINQIIGFAETALNKPINQINNLIWAINNIPGVNIQRIPTISIPRLKTGAIINQPGRGVPVAGGRAIGGEAGAEGIIPLTDSQAMEILGETIGRYITINANIINTMNGRVIGRQLKQIQNDSNFAYNT